MSTLALLAVDGLPTEKTGQDAAATVRQSPNHIAEVFGSEAPSCAGWNTSQFFEPASAEVVAACIAAGADPNMQDEDGITPLHHAASHENVAATKALITAGADLNAKDYMDNTPLHYAVYTNVETCRAGNDAVIQTLIAADADLNAQEAYGLTPLHGAALCHQPSLALALIAAGADSNAGDEEGATPLHHAAAYAEEGELIDVLIAAGADVNGRDSSGRTPLHCLADGRYSAASDPPTAELLIAHGADVNAQDEDGNTALHLAAASPSRNADSMIIAMLDAGADPLLPNAVGEIPWGIAKSNKNNESLQNSPAVQRLNPVRFETQTE